MMSTIALIVASITACGTLIKEINICLNADSSQPQMQQIVNQTSTEHVIEDLIGKQLDQRDSDTEIGIKINVSHTIPHDDRK